MSPFPRRLLGFAVTFDTEYKVSPLLPWVQSGCGRNERDWFESWKDQIASVRAFLAVFHQPFLMFFFFLPLKILTTKQSPWHVITFALSWTLRDLRDHLLPQLSTVPVFLFLFPHQSGFDIALIFRFCSSWLTPHTVTLTMHHIPFLVFYLLASFLLHGFLSELCAVFFPSV